MLMVGLALEGGGAKGSYQVGAYFALKKCHIKIDAVTGTSIGSLNAAFIASHDEKKMKKLWEDASMSSILGLSEELADELMNKKLNFKNIKYTLSELSKIIKDGGLDVSNYSALVRNNINEDKLRKSNIIYGLTTVKEKGLIPIEKFLDTIPYGKVHDYIVASSFLPIFKKRKLIDDSYYMDGGLYNLSPVDMLQKIGCDKIYVINIRGIGFRKKVNYNNTKIIDIKPSNSLGSIVLFNQESTLSNIYRGYFDTMKVLGKYDGIDFYFKKKSNFYYKRLIRKNNMELYTIAKGILHSNDYKDTIIKALEYVLSKEKCKILKVYDIKSIVKSIKYIDTKNIIYRFVKSLHI